MYSEGLFSIGGIASGLDTNAIVEELLALERRPAFRLAEQQDSLRQTRDAWSEVTTKLSSLRGAVDAVARPDAFDAFVSVTSSDASSVAVSAHGTLTETAIDVTVEQLATGMRRSAADEFASLDDSLDGRTLELTVDGVVHDVTGGLGPDATLGDLVDAVNDLGLGVTASTLPVSTHARVLVLASDRTGADSAFDVAVGGWEHDLRVTQDAVDALLDVGGVTVTRPSNTIDDLVDGVTMELLRETVGPVTVTAERDVDGAVAAVSGLVDGVNAALERIGALTDHDAQSGRSGPLQGQQSATRLLVDLRSAMSSPVEGRSGLGSLPSSVGIELTRRGEVTLDEDRLRTALAEDWDGARALVGRVGTTADTQVTAVTGGSATAPGTYEVVVDQAAEIAQLVGATAYTPPEGDPTSFRISRPGGPDVVVTLTSEHTTVGTAVARINQALRAAGEDHLEASETDEGAIALSETRYGSAHALEVVGLDEVGEDDPEADVYGLAVGPVAGQDVAGTIGGHPATGVGTRLTATEGPAEGLGVHLEGEPRSFEVTFSHGLAGSVAGVLAQAEGVSGTVARAQGLLDGQIRLYQERIDAFDDRLARRETTLRRQFVALESALHQFNEQGAWLDQQLAGLART